MVFGDKMCPISAAKIESRHEENGHHQDGGVEDGGIRHCLKSCLSVELVAMTENNVCGVYYRSWERQSCLRVGQRPGSWMEGDLLMLVECGGVQMIVEVGTTGCFCKCQQMAR